MFVEASLMKPLHQIIMTKEYFISLLEYDRWNDFLNEDKTDLGKVVSYVNSQGEHFNSKLVDILPHLFTHNHYHRGQINQILRQSGFEPVRVDYIVYVRE